MSTADFQPITVPASRVLAAGITPARFAVWAIEKHRDGKPEQAVRLLAACSALVQASHREGCERTCP